MFQAKVLKKDKLFPEGRYVADARRQRQLARGLRTLRPDRVVRGHGLREGYDPHLYTRKDYEPLSLTGAQPLEPLDHFSYFWGDGVLSKEHVRTYISL